MGGAPDHPVAVLAGTSSEGEAGMKGFPNQSVDRSKRPERAVLGEETEGRKWGGVAVVFSREAMKKGGANGYRFGNR